MATVGEILSFLDKKFPLDTALAFDNVGLLVGSENDEVKKVLVSLDCTLETVKAAVKDGASLIVTHHPLMFAGVKTVTEESVVYRLIKNGISLIAMHTNLDIAKGGVSETLAAAAGLSRVKSYAAEDGFTLKCGTTDKTAEELAAAIKSALGFNVRYVGSGTIKNVLVCSGSGGDYITDAIKGDFDALVTADVKHHQFIEAQNNGVALFDCGHYASENIIVNPLCALLQKKFKDITFSEFNNTAIKSV